MPPISQINEAIPNLAVLCHTQHKSLSIRRAPKSANFTNNHQKERKFLCLLFSIVYKKKKRKKTSTIQPEYKPIQAIQSFYCSFHFLMLSLEGKPKSFLCSFELN